MTYSDACMAYPELAQAYDNYMLLLERYVDLSKLTKGQKSAVSKLWHEFCLKSLKAGYNPYMLCKLWAQP